MKTALFIMLPYPSHYFVGFGKANRLKQEEYHVVFTGLKTHQTLVEREGFAFESLLYASQYKRLTWKMGLAIFIQSSLNKAYTIKRYYTFWEEVKAIQDLAQKIMPDLVFIDSHLGHYVLYLWQTQCEKIILNTKLSSYPSKGIPPLTEGWTANETLLAVYRAWCNWQWHFMKRTWKKWIEKMVFLCKDDEWLHRRLAQKTGKSLDQWFEYKHCFYPAVKGLPKLITYPQAIEYPWKKTRADEIYEIIPFQRHETHLFSEEYNQLITHLQHLKTQHPTTKIIYANLGTTGLNNTPEGVQTLKKIAEAIQKLPHVQLVIAAPFFERKSYPNVHWLTHVPQLDMLRYADLMITHGGLNSICECLQVGVPMLLCPLGHTADHFGNAARVVYHGWGLLYDVQKSPQKVLKAAINTLIAESKPSKQPLKQAFLSDFAK